MADFVDLLRTNRNYRCTWLGQVVSEIGDYFNNIAVFSLVMQTSGSGLVVSGVMLARAIPAVMAGPIAGVVLDRFDRKKIMIASDLIRAVVALAFIATMHQPRPWLLYLLSGLLMFASPFFTSGRAAILPTIASPTRAAHRQLADADHAMGHADRGHDAGGLERGQTRLPVGVHYQFALLSVFCRGDLAAGRAGGSFRAQRQAPQAGSVVRPWHEYREGLQYIRSTPLILGIGLLSVGWAAGGGAAQILFTLFGEQVFKRGAAGIGEIWGMAGVGLLIGGALAHLIGRRMGFAGIQALGDDFLPLARRHVRGLQPGAPVLAGADSDLPLARGDGGMFGAELLAVAAAHAGRVSRARVRHHGVAALGYDDRSRWRRRGSVRNIAARGRSAWWRGCWAR